MRKIGVDHNRRPGGEETHIHVFDLDSIHDNWDSKVKAGQYPHQSELKQWAPLHNLSLLDGIHWYRGTTLVVVADNSLRRGVISLFHDHVCYDPPQFFTSLLDPLLVTMSKPPLMAK